MSKQEEFELMLKRDEAVYKNIVKAKTLITAQKNIAADYRDGKRDVLKDSEQYNSFIGPLNEQIRAYNKVLNSYRERQNDYRTNEAYALGKWINEKTDATIKWFSNLWDSVFNGLAAAPLVVPVALVIGGTVSVSVISYFVYKYNALTVVDYNESARIVAELAKTNPELANEILKGATNAQNQQSKGFFSELGTGVKVAIVVVGIGVASAIGYGIYESIKNKKTK